MSSRIGVGPRTGALKRMRDAGLSRHDATTPLSFAGPFARTRVSGGAATKTATATRAGPRPLRRRRRHGRPRRRRGRVARRRRGDPGLHRGNRRRRQEPHLAVPVRSDAQPRSQSLKAAFRLANRRIAARDRRLEDLRGMATTASALLAGAAARLRRARRRQPRLRAARRRSSTQITHDHSWVEEQVRAGTMSPTRGAAASVAQRRHAGAVGRRRSGSRRRPKLEPQPGERYLLCSDGLFSVVTDDADRARFSATRASRSRTICRQLIDAANDGGGPDNITALVLEVDAP